MANRRVLPVIRHLSPPVTAVLLRTPLSANHVTFIALAAGLAASWAMTYGTWSADLAGAAMFLLYYILDNSDGEVARAKDQSSTFGARFDTLVDWLVHAAFFAALGAGYAARAGGDLWLWLGLAAAAGSTINYGLVLIADLRGQAPDSDEGPKETLSGPKDMVIYALRELSRADFCFIVLALAIFDVAWVLLPAAAVGAQVYWIAQPFARSHKV